MFKFVWCKSSKTCCPVKSTDTNKIKELIEDKKIKVVKND